MRKPHSGNILYYHYLNPVTIFPNLPNHENIQRDFINIVSKLSTTNLP